MVADAEPDEDPLDRRAPGRVHELMDICPYRLHPRVIGKRRGARATLIAGEQVGLERESPGVIERARGVMLEQRVVGVPAHANSSRS